MGGIGSRRPVDDPSLHLVLTDTLGEAVPFEPQERPDRHPNVVLPGPTGTRHSASRSVASRAGDTSPPTSIDRSPPAGSTRPLPRRASSIIQRTDLG